MITTLAALAAAACQDAGSGPDWRLQDLHTRVGLEGGHRTLACSACHGPASLAPVDPACVRCHRDAYEQTTAPGHLQAGYPTACESCHTPQGWRPATFDHAAVGWPLEGGHARAACSACHRDGIFGPLPEDCWSCHADDYEGARDPDHQLLSFGRNCAECHTAETWGSGRFAHEATGFALDGAHAGAGCAACHRGGYSDTPSACATCHQAAEPPNHFGPDCGGCHGTQAWVPATFDHEVRFPLQRGDHRRYRESCRSCHPDAASWASFTCTDCHDGEHARSRMDREHAGVRDYQYASSACYRCHPRGSED